MASWATMRTQSKGGRMKARFEALSRATHSVLRTEFIAAARRNRLRPDLAAKIFAEAATAAVEKVRAVEQQQIERSKSELRSRWGAEHDARMAVARRGFEAFGFDDEGALLLGDLQAFEHMHGVGQRLAGDAGDKQTGESEVTKENMS